LYTALMYLGSAEDLQHHDWEGQHQIAIEAVNDSNGVLHCDSVPEGETRE